MRFSAYQPSPAMLYSQGPPPQHIDELFFKACVSYRYARVNPADWVTHGVTTIIHDTHTHMFMTVML